MVIGSTIDFGRRLFIPHQLYHKMLSRKANAWILQRWTILLISYTHCNFWVVLLLHNSIFRIIQCLKNLQVFNSIAYNKTWELQRALNEADAKNVPVYYGPLFTWFRQHGTSSFLNREDDYIYMNVSLRNCLRKLSGSLLPSSNWSYQNHRRHHDNGEIIKISKIFN